MSETRFGKLPLNDLNDDVEYLKTLIYGPSGAGKTVLAGSAQDVVGMSPVLFLDIEGGTESAGHFYPGSKFVTIETTADMTEAYRTLKLTDHGFKTVVIDSLTELHMLYVHEIAAKGAKEDSDRDEDEIYQGDWGKARTKTLRLIRRFRNLDMNVIFTGLDDVSRDNKGRRTTTLLIAGKLQQEVPGMFQTVFYLYTKETKDEVKRYLLTRRTDTVMAKDRTNRFPAVLENPTMAKIWDALKSEPKGEVAG